MTIDVADMMGELLAKRLTVKTVEIEAEVVVWVMAGKRSWWRCCDVMVVVLQYL